jgi:Domain of unknown function (DUF6457)
MELKHWLTTLSGELRTSDVAMDEDAVHILLDLARDSAHEVERVAAPLTTYLVGIAVGRGATLGSAAATATALLMTADSSGDNLDAASATDARSVDEASD